MCNFIAFVYSNLSTCRKKNTNLLITLMLHLKGFIFFAQKRHPQSNHGLNVKYWRRFGQSNQRIRAIDIMGRVLLSQLRLQTTAVNPLTAALKSQSVVSAKQWTIIQQCGDWYIGRWWVGCYIWYSEAGPAWAGCGQFTYFILFDVAL